MLHACMKPRVAGVCSPLQVDGTPLYAACQNGHVEVTKVLLSARAKVNQICLPVRSPGTLMKADLSPGRQSSPNCMLVRSHIPT